MKAMKGMMLALAVLGTVGLRSESDLGAWSRVACQGSWQTGRLATIAADSRVRFEQDSEDYESRLTYAVATLARLYESEAFQAVARQFGFTVDYFGMSFQGQVADVARWPSLNDLVDAAVEEGLPVLDDALSVLEGIPDTWSGEVRLSPTDYPMDEEVLVDIGDVLYARAGLEATIGLLCFAAGYDLTLDWSKAKAIRDYCRTIPSVASAPSLTTDEGWAEAVRGLNDVQFLFSGGKLFVRLNRAEGFVTTNALDYLELEMKNCLTGASYGFYFEQREDCEQTPQSGNGGYYVWFDDGSDPAPERSDYFTDFDWACYDWDDYEERLTRYTDDYEAWEAACYRPNVTVRQNATSIVAVIDLTEKPSLTAGGTWTVDEVGEVGIRMKFYPEHNFWSCDWFSTKIRSEAARASRVLMEQSAFAATARDLDALTISKEWMSRALSHALAADASVRARSANGPLHFIEYDPQDAGALAQARTLTGRALAALESEQEFDALLFSDAAAKVGVDLSLLPNGGLLRVYLGALFDGKISRDLLPTFQKGEDEEPVPVAETVSDPTLAGLLPDMTLETWIALAKNAGIPLAHVPVTVRLDANGGEVEPTDLTLSHNPETDITNLGDLPLPTRTGHTFAGWFTAVSNGTEMTAGTAVLSSNMTLYAHWTVNQYAVTFDANGGTGGTSQRLDYGTVVMLPTVTRDGYEFRGWFTAAEGGAQVPEGTRVSENVTYYAHWMAIHAGTLAADLAKAQTVTSALYDMNDALAGTVQVKVGKINARNGQVKVSAIMTLMDGKKVVARAVTLTLGADNTLEGQLVFKDSIGALAFTMTADGRFTLKNAFCRAEAADVGGTLPDGKYAFRLVDFDLAVDGVQEQLLPYGETIVVAGGKWKLAKNATVKWAKDRVTKEFGLVVDKGRNGEKANLSSLKLMYAAKTGIFKGSFKVYALEGGSGQTKLKKYMVNVIGVVVGGTGKGQATCKKPVRGPWAVTIGMP